MIAKSVKVLPRNPNSLDQDPSVIEIMDQIDQMFQLLEKSSEGNFGYVESVYAPIESPSSRWVSLIDNLNSIADC